MADPIEGGARPPLPPAGEPADADPAGSGTETPDDLAAIRHALDRERALRREGERQIKGLQAENRELKSGELRRQIALELDLPPSLAGRLRGMTREELLADGQDLLEAFRPPDPAASLRVQPAEKLKPGAVPQAEPFDAGAIVDKIKR
jgi:hypothetical protein